MSLKPFFVDSSYVTYAGQGPDGCTRWGQIPREGVNAFIRLCVAERWKSVAVAQAARPHILAKFVGGHVTINEAAA